MWSRGVDVWLDAEWGGVEGGAQPDAEQGGGMQPGGEWQGAVVHSRMWSGSGMGWWVVALCLLLPTCAP